MRSLGRLAARRVALQSCHSTALTHQLPLLQMQSAAGDGVRTSLESVAAHSPCRSHRQSLHSSAAVLVALDVVVPSMGDSITEGTIVNVSKSKGDSVEEDEVIAQIETDKVTIDVRAPSGGTLAEILVSDDQNVEVGDVVARLDDAGGGSSGEAEAKSSPAARVGGTPADSERPNPKGKEGSPKSQVKDSKAPKKAESSSSSSGRGGSKKAAASAEPAPKIGGQPMDSKRPQPGGEMDAKAPSDGKAHMVFPPRRLEDGQRISDLPPDTAAHHTQRLSGSSIGEGEQQQEGGEAEVQQQTGSESEGVMRRRWAVGAPLPMDEDWQPAPGKWALSEAEMEMIDLGGADP